MLIKVKPVVWHLVIQKLCQNPYRGHKKGCPNYNKKKGCPPKSPLFYDMYNQNHSVFAVVNEFNLEAHVGRMLEKHPDWSLRQARCCLYWQGTARKQLKEKLQKIIYLVPQSHVIDYCPEARGVNVTKTLRDVGIFLEWPPEKIVRQVAFLAAPLNKT